MINAIVSRGEIRPLEPLPTDWRDGQQLHIEKVDRVLPATWPPGFFDSIRISDPAFARPEQGAVPLAPIIGQG